MEKKRKQRCANQTVVHAIKKGWKVQTKYSGSDGGLKILGLRCCRWDASARFLWKEKQNRPTDQSWAGVLGTPSQ